MGHEVEGNNNNSNYCFSKIQLVGQKSNKTKHLSLDIKARLESFSFRLTFKRRFFASFREETEIKSLHSVTLKALTAR